MLQEREKEAAVKVTDAERQFKKSERRIGESREALRQKLREEMAPKLAAAQREHPSGVDLEASLTGLWTKAEHLADGEMRRVILEELRRVAAETGTADAPGGPVVDLAKSIDQEPNTDTWPFDLGRHVGLSIDPPSRNDITFEEALAEVQQKFTSKDVRCNDPDVERRRDALRDFFEGTKSAIVVDGKKIIGVSITPEHAARWQSIWDVGDLAGFVSAAFLVSWSIARPAEARRFAYTLDHTKQSKFTDMLTETVDSLRNTHPDGFDAEKSLTDTMAPLGGPGSGWTDSFRRALVQHGVRDVPGGPIVKLIDVRELLIAVEPEGVDLDAATKLARELIWPPSLTSARNVEVAVMSSAEFIIAVGLLRNTPEGIGYKENECELLIERCPNVMQRIMTFIAGVPRAKEEGAFTTSFIEFTWHWRCSTFARLEVGHKLAASLCLTDVHDLKEKGVDVRAPWEAWSLVVPDGLLGDAARVWLVGTEPAFLVRAGGQVELWASAKLTDADRDMLVSLALGSCLALSNPDEFKKEGAGGRNGSSGSNGSKRRRGEPDQVRYLLSAPVTIDLRDRVREARTGKGGGPMKVQSLTRGHWKSQPWGPRHSLRRPTWIKPYFRGSEEAKMLLRSHKVEET